MFTVQKYCFFLIPARFFPIILLRTMFFLLFVGFRIGFLWKIWTVTHYYIYVLYCRGRASSAIKNSHHSTDVSDDCYYCFVLHVQSLHEYGYGRLLSLIDGHALKTALLEMSGSCICTATDELFIVSSRIFLVTEIPLQIESVVIQVFTHLNSSSLVSFLFFSS